MGLLPAQSTSLHWVDLIPPQSLIELRLLLDEIVFADLRKPSSILAESVTGHQGIATDGTRHNRAIDGGRFCYLGIN